MDKDIYYSKDANEFRQSAYKITKLIVKKRKLFRENNIELTDEQKSIIKEDILSYCKIHDTLIDMAYLLEKRAKEVQNDRAD